MLSIKRTEELFTGQRIWVRLRLLFLVLISCWQTVSVFYNGQDRPVCGRWEMYSPRSESGLTDLNTQCSLSCGFCSFNDWKTNSVKWTLTHLTKGNVDCMHFLTRSGAIIKNIMKVFFFFFVKLREQCETSVKGPVH